ncbi:MAG: tRNA (adenine-N1)-methyltransferase [Candidatus Bathyarchaeia archaeon]
MSQDYIQDGSDILLYLDGSRSYLVQIRRGEKFHTHRGFVSFDDIIGKKYGESVKTNIGQRFHLLRPTIYDYIVKSARSTQILYPKDIGLIVMYSAAQPGSVIVEAGTGSGALTTALANIVRPSGKVYSYDLRTEFQKKAASNLSRVGLLPYVELKHGDVTAKIEEENVDAVVLDLATPWLVIPHAKVALRGGGIIVSFSPTIEQVVKTVTALENESFVDIETIECIVRRIKVKAGETRPETLMIGHTGYITRGRKTEESKASYSSEASSTSPL